MPRICAIIGCQKQTTRFRLPARHSVRRQWIDAIWSNLKPKYKKSGIVKEEWKVPQNLTICPDHFVGGERSDVPGAPGFLPSLFLPVDVNGCSRDGDEDYEAQSKQDSIADSRATQQSTEDESSRMQCEDEETAAWSLLHLSEMGVCREDEEAAASSLLKLSEIGQGQNEQVRNNRSIGTFVTPPPKRRKRSLKTQVTPPKTKGTKMTPKWRRSVKCNTSVVCSDVKAAQTPTSQVINTVSTGIQVHCAKQNQYSQTSATYKVDDILQGDDLMKMYTGLENVALFNILLKFLESSCDCEIPPVNQPSSKSKLHTRLQLLLVLYKLKRNPIDSVLASEFGISVGSVSEIFNLWIRLMYRKFKLTNIWPSSEQVTKHMPNVTKERFPDLKIVSDCVEFSTQVPGGPTPSKQMFSHYKNAHTIKVMYSTAPNGALMHCSHAYGGAASDKEIFAKSDVPQRLKPGDGLMVDKGFLIKDAIQGKGIKLYRPPFLSNNIHQFEPEDRESGKNIARSRIIVENFNARISGFKFLKEKKIPILYMPIINEICYVCGFLANLGPLIRRKFAT